MDRWTDGQMDRRKEACPIKEPRCEIPIRQGMDGANFGFHPVAKNLLLSQSVVLDMVRSADAFRGGTARSEKTIMYFFRGFLARGCPTKSSSHCE